MECVLIGAIWNDLDNEKGPKNKLSYFSARSWETRLKDNWGSIAKKIKDNWGSFLFYWSLKEKKV